MNAVACEVHVIATGARPSEKGGQRELFTEETTTALVFEKGGVLRLSAAVVPGQLLFLTHKESKREVVAQVTRKRNFRPMTCYVEVEFSEPSPGFWGIEFPEMPALVPANAQQRAAAESAQAEEDLITGEPGEPTPAPSAEEVMALKDEVEVLREHLKLLRAQTAAGSLPTPAVTSALPRPTAPEPPRAAVDVSTQTPVHADASSQPQLKPRPATGEVSQQSPTEVSGALASTAAALPSASDSLSVDSSEPPNSEENLIPKPALNFSDAKPSAKHASKPEQQAAANSQRAALRKDMLFAAFVLITAGAAWYQNLLPWLPQRQNVFPSVASSIGAHPAPHMPQKTANAGPDAAKPAQTSQALGIPQSTGLPDASQPASSGTTQPSTLAGAETPSAVNPVPSAAADTPAVQEKSEMSASARERSSPLPSNKAVRVSAAPLPVGAAFVPPKLIKSVQAIASPNALQDFATGKGDSVTLDALVDTSGRVKSMKALSGPASLRNAAKEALKHYKYAPATRHGIPVPAHLTVKIKFLFEP